MNKPLKKSSSVPESAKTRSNTELAVDTIKSMILDNRLSSGSNHLESELAKMLGMSRTPVREATLILQAQGLLEVKPRHGVRILSLAPKDMNEIYQILTELESLAAELAAGNNLPDDEFEAAEAAIVEMDRALEIDDREAWAIADEAFHAELARLGGNERIVSILEMYNDQVRRARYLTLQLRPKPVNSNQAHRRVLDAIRNANGESARQIHKEHRMQAKTIILDLLEKYGLHHV